MVNQPNTPLAQTARLLDLVPFLLAHQGISISELAKHFKVENEVIIDDLNTLWMCGLPGYTPLELIDLAFDSGYVTIRNAAPLAYVRTMSSSEVVSLALGLDLLRESSLNLDNDQIARIDRLSAQLRAQIGSHISITAGAQTSNRSIIASSISKRLPVEMTYYSTASDQETRRIVTAYDFFQESDIEYFRAFCHTAESMRTFRVDRIVTAVLVHESKEVVNDQNPKNERIRVGATVRSLDRTSAEAFRLAYEDLEVGASVVLEAFSSEWLVRAIMAGAGSLAVEEPAEIRGLVRRSVDSAIALYE
jgi:proteasome accessory factor C